MEVSDINFDNIMENGRFTVHNAKAIAFRRCRFRGAMCGIVVGADEGICHASFENCLFEDIPNCGVAVFENANVTMINCVLRGPRICALVKEGSRFTAVHCTFHGTVQALYKVPSLLLINCTIFGASADGVSIGNATTARLLGCRIMRCKRVGVVVRGPKRSTVDIEDCVVTDSDMGYLIDIGKLDVTLLNSHAFNNEFHGLHLGASLNGSVTVNNCTFTDNNGAMDIVKLCGPDCPVVIDGVLQPLMLDMIIARKISVDMKRRKTVDRETMGECKVSLVMRRAMRIADRSLAVTICCLNCNKPEPKEVKFKACGKCNEEVYCSRECQVAHWKEHKKECGKVKYA